MRRTLSSSRCGSRPGLGCHLRWGPQMREVQQRIAHAAWPDSGAEGAVWLSAGSRPACGPAAAVLTRRARPPHRPLVPACHCAYVLAGAGACGVRDPLGRRAGRHGDGLRGRPDRPDARRGCWPAVCAGFPGAPPGQAVARPAAGPVWGPAPRHRRKSIVALSRAAVTHMLAALV